LLLLLVLLLVPQVRFDQSATSATIEVSELPLEEDYRPKTFDEQTLQLSVADKEALASNRQGYAVFPMVSSRAGSSRTSNQQQQQQTSSLKQLLPTQSVGAVRPSCEGSGSSPRLAVADIVRGAAWLFCLGQQHALGLTKPQCWCDASLEQQQTAGKHC
jgi:hypothetical protein